MPAKGCQCPYLLFWGEACDAPDWSAPAQEHQIQCTIAIDKMAVSFTNVFQHVNKRWADGWLALMELNISAVLPNTSSQALSSSVRLFPSTTTTDVILGPSKINAMLFLPELVVNTQLSKVVRLFKGIKTPGETICTHVGRWRVPERARMEGGIWNTTTKIKDLTPRHTKTFQPTNFKVMLNALYGAQPG